MTARKDIVVIGAGAMGALYATMLAPHANVTIVDEWRDQIDAIRRQGLAISGILGDRRPALRALHADEAARFSGTADIAISLVSAQHSPRAARLAKQMLRPDGYLVTLQNGVGNIEAYEAELGSGRTIPGLSYHSARIVDLGHIEHTHRGPTWIGEIDRSRSPRIEALFALFETAGAQPTYADDIVGWVWSKFIHNCAINAVCAAAGLRVGEIPTTPGADELQTRIIEECIAVVRAKGITLADADPMAAIKAFCRIKFNKPSMLQQIEANRESEIEALNAAVVREGAALGIPTPYNQAITWVIQSIQHQRIKTLQQPDIDYAALEKRAKELAT